MPRIVRARSSWKAREWYRQSIHTLSVLAFIAIGISTGLASQPRWEKIGEDDLYVVCIDRDSILKTDRVINVWVKFHSKDFRGRDQLYRQAYRCDKKQIIPQEPVDRPFFRSR